MNQAKVAPRSLEGASAEIAILNPLVSEIVSALLDLGGAAHRDLVAAHIAGRRGIYRPPETLRRELDEAFSAYCQGATDPRDAGLLHLPYGPFSHRWALTDQAYALLRGGPATGSRIGIGVSSR
jgi:hypothetical protein